MKKPPSAFTLIELLVVLAIIAVLTSFASVAWGSAQRKAQTSASISNLRNWGAAYSLYVADSNGMLPYEGTADQPNWNHAKLPANRDAWFNVLPPYVGAKAIGEFTAADQKAMWEGTTLHRDPRAKLDRRTIGNRPPFCYMMNSQLPSGGRVRLAAVERPALTVFMMETLTSPDDRLPGAPQGGSAYARGKGRNNNVSARHDGKVNVLFMDGHVRTFDSDYVFNGGRDPKSNPANDNLPDLRWTLAAQ